MEYRYLGNTGLQVSLLGFGHMLAQDTPEFQATFDSMIQKCLDAGVNYFDTAEAYTGGLMETVLGKSLKNAQINRDYFIISTKFFWKGTLELQKPIPVNKIGLSTKHILEAAKASLSRLQLDNVDIVFCHKYDAFTSIEETCRAMNWLIENNKAYYWGTSDWSSAEITEAFSVCDRLGLIKPVTEQCQYNQLVRQNFEVEYGTIFDKYRYGSTVWSPLCFGVLTDKYIDGFPDDSRWAQWKTSQRYMSPFLNEKERPNTVKKLKDLQVIADELNCTLPQLALAWIMRNKDVSSILMGASKLEQLTDNLKSLDVYKNKYNQQINQRIEEILQNKPEPYLDYKLWKKFDSRI